MISRKRLFFAVMPIFILSGCYTTHTPFYVQSDSDQTLLIGAPEAHVDVTRNYFLVFGGANKRPMMAEARQQLSIKYAGFVPFQFVNLSVDEAKSNYFFLYTQHRLTITANMLFKKPEYVDMAKEAISDMQDYGLVKGDRVLFKYIWTKDKNGQAYGQGTIKELANNNVFIELDSATRSNPKFKDSKAWLH